MNKKFTMMLAAFMAAGYTMTVDANVVKFENPEKGVVSYALKATTFDAGENLTSFFYEGGYIYIKVSTEGYLYENDGVISVAALDKADKGFYWKFNKDSEEEYGTITSANGKQFVVGNETKFTIDPNNESFNLVGAAATDKQVTYSTENGFELGAQSTKLFTAEANDEYQQIDADVFNEKVNGAFSVVYKIGNETAKNNPFQNVTAIQVGSTTGKYPAGTYFVVDAPASLDIDKTNYSEADLNKLTFVTISPYKEYSNLIETKYAGIGCEFVSKKGSDLLKLETGNEATKNNRFVANNACFTMEQSVLDSKKMSFYANPYVNNSDATKDVLEQVNNIVVGAVKVGSEVFVTTTTPTMNLTQNIVAEMGSENVITADKFLSASDAKIFNIQFLSQRGHTTDASQSEYLKYLTIAAKPNGTSGSSNNAAVTLAGSDYTDLTAAYSQWIVANMDKNTGSVTFKNLESGDTFTTILVKTDNENEYRLTGVNETGIQVIYKKDGAATFASNINIAPNMVVKLTPVEFNKTAGFVSNELDNIGLTKLSFVVENNYNSVELFLNNKYDASGEVESIELNKDKSSFYEIIKVTGDYSELESNAINYAIWKNNDVNITDKSVKNSLNRFVVKIYDTEDENGDALYLSMSSGKFDKSGTRGLAYAQEFVIKKNVNGSYSLIPVNTNGTYASTISKSATTFDLTAQGAIESENIYAAHSAKFTVAADKLNESLEAKSQHVTLSSSNTYMAVGEEGKAIMAAATELKAEYTKEDVTFWIDTVNAEAYVPTFYISKGSKQFLFNAADSVDVVDAGTGSIEENKDMLLSDGKTPRAIFRAAELKDKNQTLATTINGEAKDLKAGNGIEDYQYTITLNDADVEGEYIVRSLSKNEDGNVYLYRLNGELGFTPDRASALVLTIATAEAPTSNEVVTASEVAVVAQDGAVVVKNAAGKNVVVSTILGQVVANEVLTSDNATINVPAGIVVVAVEGESFKVNVK